jgi:hypothetical protein
MSDATAFPEEWDAMLDAMQGRLDEALAAADARAAKPAPAPLNAATAAQHRADLDALAAREAAFAAKSDDTEQVLAAAEEFLRWRLAETESLRQRLAAWTTRAIG